LAWMRNPKGSEFSRWTKGSDRFAPARDQAYRHRPRSTPFSFARMPNKPVTRAESVAEASCTLSTKSVSDVPDPVASEGRTLLFAPMSACRGRGQAASVGRIVNTAFLPVGRTFVRRPESAHCFAAPATSQSGLPFVRSLADFSSRRSRRSWMRTDEKPTHSRRAPSRCSF